MRFDQSTINIRPRSISEILDLALIFYRTHFRLLATLVGLFGLPAILLGVAVVLLIDNVVISLLIFWLFLPLTSGVVLLAASRIVFGIRMTTKEVALMYRPLMTRHFLMQLGHRLIWVPLTAVVAGVVLRLGWSFTPMVMLLERLKGKQLRLRRESLYRRGGANALGLDCLSTIVAAVFVGGIVWVFDFLMVEVLGAWDFGLFSAQFFDVINEPSHLIVLMLAVLAVQPFIGLCWFFYYLDTRIRKEGWDIELGFRAATARKSEKTEAV